MGKSKLVILRSFLKFYSPLYSTFGLVNKSSNENEFSGNLKKQTIIKVLQNELIAMQQQDLTQIMYRHDFEESWQTLQMK